MRQQSSFSRNSQAGIEVGLGCGTLRNVVAEIKTGGPKSGRVYSRLCPVAVRTALVYPKASNNGSSKLSSLTPLLHDQRIEAGKLLLNQQNR